jgi:hypothetical protein
MTQSVEDDHALMHTTEGKRRVDVIYRRIDDDLLSPLAFRRDSSLGEPKDVATLNDEIVQLDVPACREAPRAVAGSAGQAQQQQQQQ